MATLSKNIQLYSSFYNQDLLHIILYEKPVTWNYDLLLFTWPASNQLLTVLVDDKSK